MGSDGHITIHNWDKIQEYLHDKPENLKKFIERFGGYIYDNPFSSDPKKIVIAYGDNLHFNYHLLREWFEKREDPPRNKLTRHTIADHILENTGWYGELTDEETDEVIVVIKWANRNAIIVPSWEVWT